MFLLYRSEIRYDHPPTLSAFDYVQITKQFELFNPVPSGIGAWMNLLDSTVCGNFFEISEQSINHTCMPEHYIIF
jgi:hypothetical protein